MNPNPPPLWAHQKEAICRAAPLAEYALFFEMGTGKTRTLIEILRHKFNEAHAILRTLILCPPIVVQNWREEWLKYSAIASTQVVPLTGSGKKRLKNFATCIGKTPHRVFITNYEALLMAPLLDSLMSWGPEVIVLDESHKCKDSKAKRTKLATKLGDRAGFHYLLSGSPVLNSPLDLFSQFRILDGGETFGNNFFAFRARYFRDRNAGMPRDRYFPDWQILPGAVEEISKRISAKSMSVKKEDCLDLPPLVRQVVRVGMTKDQERLYKQMKKDLVAYLESTDGKKEASVATLAITKALRLMQITSGFLAVSDGADTRMRGLPKTPKMDALRELLADLTPNHKVLVWAVWRENYGQIKKVCEDLGLRYVEVHGDVSDKRKQEAVASFNSDDDVRVLIGHPGSGGIGINLVAASYSIFFSRTFSLEHSIQAEARNHRGGSEIHDKITRIDIVCDGTIDEEVVKRLTAKEEISEAVLREIRGSI